MRTNPVSLSAIVLAVGMIGAAAPSHAVEVSVHNLVTDDQAANPAQITDAGLVNAWGISYSPTSPFWVSSNGGGTSTLYKVDPVTQATTKVALTVTIPGAGNVTGQVFNSGGASQFNGNNFLFVSEDGTVSGWRGALGTTAETLVSSVGGIYKGAAIATVGSNSYLYAANFGTGSIDVIKGNAGAVNLTGSFAGMLPIVASVLMVSVIIPFVTKKPTATADVGTVLLPDET